MEQTNRSKLCKLQNKPGEYIYILYETITSPIDVQCSINDCAGLFDTRQDAQQVANCLNNIFSKLNDTNWKWHPYEVHKMFLNEHTRDIYAYGSGSSNDSMSSSDPDSDSEFTRRAFKFQVIGDFTCKPGNVLKSYKRDWVRYISKSFKTLEQLRKEKNDDEKNYYTKIEEKREWKIIKYRTNDILPTMYLDDYHIKTHKKKFKHVMEHLQDLPHAQAQRREMRRAKREKLLQYSDSSDSEDDTRYKRVTNRSLLHTPTRPKKN